MDTAVAKRKNPFPYRELNLGRPASSLVSSLPELLRIFRKLLEKN
jgi:hypothetical protein